MKKAVNFNAQHSPTGAFMSFTCGNFNVAGGLGVEIGRPADQQLYIGVKNGERNAVEPLRCLPFFKSKSAAGASAADFQVGQDNEQPPERKENIVTYGEDQITRDYKWATDTWTTEDFQFAVHTPFGAIPEPDASSSNDLKRALLPAVTATMTIDNRSGNSTKTAVFATKYAHQGVRILQNSCSQCGFGFGRSQGVLCKSVFESGHRAEIVPFQKWAITDGLMTTGQPVHALGTIAGVSIEVPPGEMCTITIAIGVHLDGVVTTGLDGKYFYTRFYSNLEEVLQYALEIAPQLVERSRSLDLELERSGLSDDQQFLIAHSTRSYYGSTQFLDVGGEPLWIVNEGEYCMLNTLDLSVDQQFWELDWNPWVVRNLLDSFSRRYSYVDKLQVGDGKHIAGGITFTHDMGANNHFSPAGWSSYELPKLTGCFSYMSAEQLCNWVLMACCYIAKTGDMAWLNHNIAAFESCLKSLCARGGENGFTRYDSSRCEGGAEITTYDSLDHSLAQTRNNVYMAVKCWACYVGLEQVFNLASKNDLSSIAREQASKSASAIAAELRPTGMLPAIFEKDSPGHLSRILPAVEGMIYLIYWSENRFKNVLEDQKSRPAGQQLLQALKMHTLTLLNDSESRNFFADGGIKLSSTSNNSWMSKIAIFQQIAKRWLDADNDPALKQKFIQADAAHVSWQVNGSAYWACSDQMVSGVAKGSRYYPRIITTALWMKRK